MRNLEVAELLCNMRELLEIKGENPFKVRDAKLHKLLS